MKTIKYDSYLQLLHICKVLIENDMVPTICVGGFIITDIQIVGKMITLHEHDGSLFLYSDFTQQQIIELIGILEKHLIEN